MRYPGRGKRTQMKYHQHDRSPVVSENSITALQGLFTYSPQNIASAYATVLRFN